MSIPDFDGKTVHTSRLKISGGSLDLDAIVAEIDEELDLRITVQVTKVEHTVHRISGHLNRLQHAHVESADVIDLSRLCSHCSAVLEGRS